MAPLTDEWPLTWRCARGRMQRVAPPPVVKDVTLGAHDATVGRVSVPLAGGSAASVQQLIDALRSSETLRGLLVRPFSTVTAYIVLTDK